jgi:hypothetical protein
MRAPRRLHWIPPVALAAGQFAHGASWILLFVLAAQRPFAFGLPALGWLHLVVLGWLTLTALAVLVHVIPTFTEVPWKGQRIARAALLPYAIGVVALVVGFWDGSTATLPWAAALIVLALLAYLIPATRTLASAFAGPRSEAAVARALTITLSALLITVALGAALASALDGRAPAALLASGPPIHATFGIVGWLTILVMGVSTRTVRPISGAGARYPWIHIVAAALEPAGVVAIVIGLLIAVPAIVWLGAIVLLAGALAYAGNLADVLLRATVKHRPPQAFLAAGALWLVVGFALGLAVLAGAPVGPAIIYVLLVGWVGQMVNAHIHHIGVRLIATIARGDDDETRPGELLATPLSWACFALFQFAVAAGAIALIADAPQLLAAAALAGLVGWLTLMANVAFAANRARQPQLPPDPRATISLLG